MTNEATRDQVILKWQEANKALAAAKEAELELRKTVLKLGFDFESDDREGTQNVDLGAGYKLKAVFKINRRLDNKDNGVDKVLSKIEKSGPEGEFVAERLIKWEPKLVKKEYDGLAPKFKKLIDEVITARPGTPTVSLVEPKTK